MRIRSRSLLLGLLPLLGVALIAGARRRRWTPRPRARSIDASGSVTIGRPLPQVFEAFKALDRNTAPVGPPLGHEAGAAERRFGSYGALRSMRNAQVSDSGDRQIVWESRRDEVVVRCVARFEPAPGDRGTEVHVKVHYAPRGDGPLVTLGRPFFRAVADVELGQELRRFKQLVETGEVATQAARSPSSSRAPFAFGSTWGEPKGARVLS